MVSHSVVVMTQDLLQMSLSIYDKWKGHIGIQLCNQKWLGSSKSSTWQRNSLFCFDGSTQQRAWTRKFSLKDLLLTQIIPPVHPSTPTSQPSYWFWFSMPPWLRWRSLITMPTGWFEIKYCMSVNVYPSPEATCKLLQWYTHVARVFHHCIYLCAWQGKCHVQYVLVYGGLAFFPRPWQTGFNLFTQFLSLGIIWVQMSRLPPGYRNANSLKAIRNVFVDLLPWPEIADLSNSTSTQIFYLDLRRGLAEKFIIYYNCCSWTEMLDYEHIAFWA